MNCQMSDKSKEERGRKTVGGRKGEEERGRKTVGGRKGEEDLGGLTIFLLKTLFHIPINL